LPVDLAGNPRAPHLEQELLAAAATESELVFADLLRILQSAEQPAMLCTGYHGDKVWSRDPGAEYLGGDLRRGDVSGLPLSEARLVAGTIHVAVPFLGARSIGDLVGISNSPEMAPWSVGGDYDRPIPRRLAEQSGVPRDAFGVRKRAVVRTHAAPISPSLRSDFFEWLEDSYGMRRAEYALRARLSSWKWFVARAVQHLGSLLDVRREDVGLWTLLPTGHPESLLFKWANDRLSQKMARALEGSDLFTEGHDTSKRRTVNPT
jgi:hypothetical protein